MQRSNLTSPDTGPFTLFPKVDDILLTNADSTPAESSPQMLSKLHTCLFELKHNNNWSGMASSAVNYMILAAQSPITENTIWEQLKKKHPTDDYLYSKPLSSDYDVARLYGRNIPLPGLSIINIKPILVGDTYYHYTFIRSRKLPVQT